VPARRRAVPTVRRVTPTPRPPLAAKASCAATPRLFLPAGAEAFKRDIPNAVVRFLDTGHFALETHAAEIAGAIREFLSR
jgi:hypothetical protein